MRMPTTLWWHTHVAIKSACQSACIACSVLLQRMHVNKFAQIKQENALHHKPVQGGYSDCGSDAQLSNLQRHV